METVSSALPAGICRFVFQANQANMYVYTENGEALVIDCFDEPALPELLSARNVHRVTVILTHGHWDHISGVERLKALYECRVCAGTKALDELQDPRKNLSSYFDALLRMRGKADRAQRKGENPAAVLVPDVCFEDGETFCWGDHRFVIRHTPGHTKGSICIMADERYVFTGDSLTNNGHRTVTRYPTGSQRQFEQMTAPFFEGLPKDMMILPGHGEPDKLENLISFLYKDKTDQ